MAIWCLFTSGVSPLKLYYLAAFSIGLQISLLTPYLIETPAMRVPDDTTYPS
jgi:hypothetical protein